MKSVVPEEGAMRVDEVINAVCAEGPCKKCQTMVLVTGRVCHGMYGGTLIGIASSSVWQITVRQNKVITGLH